MVHLYGSHLKPQPCFWGLGVFVKSDANSEALPNGPKEIPHPLRPMTDLADSLI